MKINLICSVNLKIVLVELLTSRNLQIDENANLCIVEKGYELPDDKLSIYFHNNTLSELISLLDILSKRKDELQENIIGKISSDRYEIIPYNNIHYFESRGNYVFCITKDKELRVKEKLYELEIQLPHNRFIRVGKSFIVNITNVKEIIPWFGRRVLLKFTDSKNEIEVSKNYVKNFKDFLGI